MEKESKIIPYEEFLKHMKKIDKLQEAGNVAKKDSRPENKDKAGAELRKLAYEALFENKEELKKQGIDITEYKPETLTADLYKRGIEYTAKIPEERSSKILLENLSDILDKVHPKNLEDIVTDKRFAEIVGEHEGLVKSNEELLQQYFAYRQLKDLSERYEKDALDEKSQKAFYSIIARFAGDELAKKAKEEGLSEEAQNIFRNIAEAAISVGALDKEVVKKNMNNYIENAEKRLRDYENENERKITDYVKEGLTIMANDKDPEKFARAKDLVYSAVKRNSKKNEKSYRGSEEEEKSYRESEEDERSYKEAA